MSYHRLSVKPLNVTLNTLMKRVAHVGLGVGAFTPILALANPTGGTVVAGQATIATPNANGLVINQTSRAAIINWQQFSIGKGQYVQFLQPSSSSVVLNRVVGGNATSILGSLNANGQVFLINPNGIFFGKSASLDVQGIVASTLDIANSNFLTGDYVFQKGTGGNATVVNQGNISTHNGGYVVLAGDYAENDGIIQARSGHVVLASGAKTTLTLSGNSLVNFAVNSATLAQLAGTSNTGSLIADGGTVVMTADVANQLKATVVNNTGLIEAHAINKNNGTITLTATGGNLVNSGTLDADAGRAAQAGGAIVLKADGLTDLTNTSKITATGNGADGGNLEISGRSINVRGSATLGKGGNMLLDPGSISISTGANNTGVASNNTSLGHVGVGFIQTHLNAGTAVAISAAHAIFANAGVHAITATGTGNLSFKVGSTGQVQLGGVDITIGGALTASMASGSFGFIQAKSVGLHANSLGVTTLHNASTAAGVVQKNSVKATGGSIDITGFRIGTSHSAGGHLALSAKTSLTLGAEVGFASGFYQGDLTLVAGTAITDTALIHTAGNVNITANNGAVTLGKVVTGPSANVTITATGGAITDTNILDAGGNLTVTNNNGAVVLSDAIAAKAVTVTDAGGAVTMHDIAAYGGAVTITDTTGNMTVGIVSGHGVNLNDGAHVLSFDHSAGTSLDTVLAHGALSLKAATIQTAGNELFLRASSGDAITVKGNLSLANKKLVIEDGHGGTVSLDHNVAARAVTLIGTNLAFTGAGPNFSVSASDGDLILDASIGAPGATGGVKYNVGLKDAGYGIYIQKSIFTGNTAAGAAANVTATQIGSAPSAFARGVFVGNGSNGAVTVSAAGNVTLKGHNVGVGHAISSPAIFGAVTVAAGKNVTFSASGTGSFGGAVGVLAENARITTAGTKDTSILVQAGGNIKFSGRRVDIRAGDADASLGNNGSGSASANVSLKAGGNVTLTGGASGSSHVNVAAGDAFASGNVAGATKKVNANANVSITAGNSIILTAGPKVDVSGGYGHAQASAHGSVAGNMTATANANVSLTAKKGNITLTANNLAGTVKIHTAGFAGEDGYGSAIGTSNHATATAHGDVTLKAGGGISLTGSVARLSVGYGAGLQDSGTGHQRIAHASGNNDVATFTATNDLSITAGAGGVTLTGVSEVFVNAGGGILNGASAEADADGAKATATASGRVDIVTTGAFTETANNFVGIQGGGSVAARTIAEGNEGGSAAITGNGGVAITAAAITLGSAGIHSASVAIRAGSRVASQVLAHASDSYGGATVTGLSSVSLTATGAIKILASGPVFIGAGSEVGRTAVASASNHGKTAVNAGANVSLQGASLKVTSTNSVVEMSAGYGVAGGAVAGASSGSAAVTATANVNLTIGGNITLTGKNFVGVRGGNSAAAGFQTGHSSNTGSHTFGSHGSFSHTHNQIFSNDYTAASANGAGAKATVSGTAGMNVTATGTLAISQTAAGSGSVRLAGGSNAGFAAHTQASDGAAAAVNGNGALSIKAGALSVNGFRVNVGGGGGAVRGASSSRHIRTHFGQMSFGEGLQSFGTAGTTTFSAPKANTANGAGATAKVSGDASVTIKTGALTLTGGDSVRISAGYGGGAHDLLQASNGGLASASAKSGVNITATAFTATVTGGGVLELHGAGSAGGETSLNAHGTGAQALLTVNGQVNLTAKTVTMTAANDIEIEGGGSAGAGATVTADAGGVAKLSGDASVNINAGTVSLTATTGTLQISGGYRAGSHDDLTASSGGLASISAKSGVNITATTFTATANGSNGLVLRGGGFHVFSPSDIVNGSSGKGASINAASAGAKALLNTSGQVTITAATVSLNAANDIFIAGADNAGSSATVTAGAGGSAAFTANGGVNITATTAFTAALTGATAHGDIDLHGGSRGGHGASIAASGSGAKATLTGNDDVNITATGGTVTLQTGKHVGASLEISAGNLTADNMTAAATQGTATATVSGNVNLTAAGAITLNAGKGSIRLNGDGGGNSVVRGASASAAAGGKTTVTASDNINLTGGAVTLKAGTFASSGTHHNLEGGSIDIHVGQEEVASNAHAGASNGGSANLTTNTQVNIKATGGALTIAAGGDVSVGYGCCSRHTGFSASAGAGGGSAKAALNINDGMTFQATGAVTLTAGDNLSITTASGPNDAGASAGFKGQAVFNLNNAVNIVAGGAFTAKAADELSISAGPGGSGGNFAHASHAGALASFQSNGGLNITAATVAMSAGSELKLFAGGGGGKDGGAGVSNGATANFTSNRNLNITAKNSIAVTLTGKTSGGDIEIDGGSSVGAGAQAHASHGGGKATVTDTANTNLTVTGATGTITVTAGSHAGADVGIRANDVATPLSSGTFVAAGAFAGKGGSAALTASGTVSLTAKGAVTVNAGAGGDLLIKAGGALAFADQAEASSGGKATVNAAAGTTLSGGIVTLTGGSNVAITGASRVAGGIGASSAPHVGVNAQRGGIAAITATDGTTIVSKGALTVTAGSDLTVYAGGTDSGAETAEFASVNARSGNAQATLNVTNGVRLTAATVTLTATKGRLSIEAGSDTARRAEVSAGTHKDKATFNADDGIAITATGAITAKAGGSLFIEGGESAGNSDSVHAGNAANASLTATAGVTIKAGGAFTAKVNNGDLDISAGYGVGAFASAGASDHGIAAYSANAGVSITASAISLTAAVAAASPGEGSIFIGGGNRVGVFAGAHASDSGQANYSALSNVSLSATGGITLAAKGNLVIRAGGESFNQGNLFGAGSGALRASGSNGGVAKAATNSGISITAGGALGLSAKDNIEVSGGYGEFAIVNSVLGSASAALNGGVSLKATGAVTATAGGNLTLHGGSEAGIGGDLFLFVPSSIGAPPPGVINGTVTTGVSLAGGGAVTLTAGGDVTVAAGAGETLAVGKMRILFPSGSGSPVGHSWGGGSANLAGDLSATVTAGKTLTITAGTAGSGNILVQGLGNNPGASSGFENIVSVRGGSSHAVANVSLNGNATLTAGSNIVLAAARLATATGPSHKGNISIMAGGIDNVRADHNFGNVTLTGSADAGLTAGHDVVLNAGGSLTVAAAGALGGFHETLIDAHAGSIHNHSGSASVTGHVDAFITAGHDITATLGGGLNVLGGNFLDVVAIGSADGAQRANGTANATLTAGDIVTITGGGNLNVLGGAFGVASGTAAPLVGSVSDTIRTANLQAKTGISGNNGVTLTFTGSGVIAGGDSMTAKTKTVFGAFTSDTATADVSTTITGANISLTVGKSLLVRAGGSDKLNMQISAPLGSSSGNSNNSATATMNADTNLTATKNITIKVGKAGVPGGSASFLGGNAIGAQLFIGPRNGNRANGTTTADLNVTAGGNISLNVAGGLQVAGGQGAGGSGIILAGSPSSFGPANNGGFASAKLSAHTAFTAGGALAVTLHGGNASFLGGAQGASGAFVFAVASSGSAKAIYNVDNSLSLKAGGALTVTGAGNVAISTEIVAPSAGLPVIFPLGHQTNVTVNVNSSVKITGKTVNINGGHNVTTNSAGTFGFSSPASSSFGAASLFLDGRITITATGATPPVFSVRSLGIHTLGIAPRGTETSFGGSKSLSSLPVTSVTPVIQTDGQVDLTSGLLIDSDSATQTLGTVQSMSTVLSLETLVAPSQDGDVQLHAAFVPQVDAVPYQDAQAGQCLSVRLTGPAGCASRR